MIKIGAKTLNIKKEDGTWESLVASGVTVDSAIDETSDNAVANSAVAKALDDKISKSNLADNTDIDNLFEKEGN